MKRLRICLVWGVFALVGGLFFSTGASAQGYHYLYLVPWQQSDVGLPYFAAHPPVYYSYIVPRPYGYSPHAYVPGIVTPSFELGAGPLRITNPYWVQPRGDYPTNRVSIASYGERQPKVVFPMEVAGAP